MLGKKPNPTLSAHNSDGDFACSGVLNLGCGRLGSSEFSDLSSDVEVKSGMRVCSDIGALQIGHFIEMLRCPSHL